MNNKLLLINENTVSYWWVNHSQTYKIERYHGLLWSPKRSKAGRYNQYYENMTLVQKGDIVFSFANGFIGAIGIITMPAMENPRPSYHAEIQDEWGKIGWIVGVEWTYLNPPFKPKDYFDKISPLLPEIYSPLTKIGNGNQGAYLVRISADLGILLMSISGIEQHFRYKLFEYIHTQEEKEIENEIEKSPDISKTEKDHLIKSRIGQGIFRTHVEEIEKCCRVTGISDKRFLIASHIKPWKDSTNEERLDGNNGLLLSPHVDKLFDNGWITFTDDGDILVAHQSINTTLIMWGIDPSINVGSFNYQQKHYLHYHHSNIFKGGNQCNYFNE